MQPQTPDQLTVERPTTEEALTEVSAQLGPGAEIVTARKVARGGIAGFFAREMVQLTARPSPVAEPRHPLPTASAVVAKPAPTAVKAGVTAVLDRLSQSVDDEEARFQDVLRRELGSELIDRAVAAPPRPVAPAPAAESEPAPPAAAEPVPAAPVTEPAVVGAPAWDVVGLARLGLPQPLVAAVAGVPTADDFGWLTHLAEALEPLVAPATGLPATVVGPLAPAIPAGDGPGTHLVVGGEAWREALTAAPAAVSWVAWDGLADALYLATTLGAKLAFGPIEPGGPPARVTALDVALVIRRQVGRR